MSDMLTVSPETVFEGISVGIGIADPRIILMNSTFRATLNQSEAALPTGAMVEDGIRANPLRGV